MVHLKNEYNQRNLNTYQRTTEQLEIEEKQSSRYSISQSSFIFTSFLLQFYSGFVIGDIIHVLFDHVSLKGFTMKYYNKNKKSLTDPNFSILKLKLQIQPMDIGQSLIQFCCLKTWFIKKFTLRAKFTLRTKGINPETWLL